MFDLNYDLLKKAQVDHMFDEAVLQEVSTADDSFGQTKVTYTDGVTTVCGVDLQPGSERRSADTEPVTWDATVRLPTTVDISRFKRLKITKRHLKAITPIIFEVASPPQLGPSAIRIRLRKVEL